MCNEHPPRAPHPSRPQEQDRHLCQTSIALSSGGRGPRCASHICGCSITAPQVLQGWWQDPGSLVSGQSLNCQALPRGRSPAAAHCSALLPPPLHTGIGGTRRERRRGKPSVPPHKGLQHCLAPWQPQDVGQLWRATHGEVPLIQTRHTGSCSPCPGRPRLSHTSLPALLTQAILATRGSNRKVGLVRTIWPTGHKQRKKDEVQTQGKSLLLRDGTWDHEGAPAHTCATAGTAVLGALVQRTSGSRNEHQETYCTEAADGA